MDALKLNLKAKDQLHPFLTELMSGYSKFKGSAEWDGRAKILHWLIELNAMKASDEITDEQSRQVGSGSAQTRSGRDLIAKRTDALRH
jgi:ESCRT-I complex subunit VPS28